MKSKRDVALEIFGKLEDDDLVNFFARNSSQDVVNDMLKSIESILENYVIIQGQIVE